MDTGGMGDQRRRGPIEKRSARDAGRKGDKVRRRAIEQAMLAGWADEDADELNWLNEAVGAHPGPEVTAYFLYGLTTHLVDRLAQVSGQQREQVLKDLLQ